MCQANTPINKSESRKFLVLLVLVLSSTSTAKLLALQSWACCIFARSKTLTNSILFFTKFSVLICLFLPIFARPRPTNCSKSETKTDPEQDQDLVKMQEEDQD